MVSASEPERVPAPSVWSRRDARMVPMRINRWSDGRKALREGIAVIKEMHCASFSVQGSGCCSLGWLGRRPGLSRSSFREFRGLRGRLQAVGRSPGGCLDWYREELHIGVSHE